MKTLLPGRLTAGFAVALSAAAAQGCTRTYDGTVVPRYQVAMVRVGALPRPVVRKTQTERPDTGKIFPIAPLPPFPDGPPPRKPRPRSADAGPPSGAPGSAIRCRQPTDASGRVRMVCE
ncbi:MAG: hypothetical protein Q8Q62_10730 [Mesorhizobium sp.]|nr:hypothetical protein [Mesorhizobium sp.]